MSRLTTALGLVAAAALLGGGVGFALTERSPGTAPAAVVVADPVVTPVGQTAGRVPWDKPLTLSVTDGTLREVTGTDPDGNPLEGTLTDDGWTSSSTLLPASTYRLKAVVVDAAGHEREVAVNTRTALPAKVLTAVVSPGDGKVVGVGQPVVVRLSQPVEGKDDRAAVVSRLRVDQPGAWRWMSPTELHYRGPDYWTAHSSVAVSTDFTRLHLSDGTWGEGVRTSTFQVGSSVIAVVDVATKQMTVTVDGQLVRTVKVSTGRDKYPTKGGVHLVLEKVKLKVMDSSTVGIPRNSPDGYYEKVPDSVRISYGGAFVHSADWSVRDQGVRNVSHGCVNVSPADAAWFFDLVKRGDVVDVKNAAVGPKLSDPGMSDWNVPYRDWAA